MRIAFNMQNNTAAISAIFNVRQNRLVKLLPPRSGSAVHIGCFLLHTVDPSKASEQEQRDKRHELTRSPTVKMIVSDDQ